MLQHLRMRCLVNRMQATEKWHKVSNDPTLGAS